jgi:hypothetical protein
MSLIKEEEVKLKAFAGAPILFGTEENPVCLIPPLTIRDRIKLGEKYQQYLSLLTISTDELEDISEKIVDPVEKQDFLKLSPFEYLMVMAEFNDTFFVDLKTAFSTFIKDEILIIPRAQQIVLGDIKQGRIINKENFNDFQKVLRLQNRLDTPEEPLPNENFMQKKFRLRRKAVKKAKAKQQAKSGDTPELSDLIASVCVLGIGVTWENVMDMPIYTFYDLFSRYQKKEKYDLDVRSLLAGADSKKIKLKYWIHNNESDS